MSAHSRLHVLNTILETGLIPLLYHPNPVVVQQAASACFEGGVMAFEFTNRGDFALDTFAAVRKHFMTAQPDRLIGAGSILDAPTAALFIAQGADFIVSPVFNPEVARLCNRRKITYMPGCATPTEIGIAEEAGVEIIKLFPGQQFSPAFVKAIKGPCPWTRIMPTGGIDPTEASIQSWFEAGISAMGMGSQLFTAARLKNGEWGQISAICREVMGWIKQYWMEPL